MNCRGCQAEMQIAYEYQEQGYLVGLYYIENTNHIGFMALTEEGEWIAG